MERRDFLTSALWLPIGLTGATIAGISNENEIIPSKHSAGGNNYVMMNGIHTSFANQVNRQMKSLEMDAIFLESGAYPYINLEEKQRLFQTYSGIDMYVPSIAYSQRHKIPLVLGDMPMTSSNPIATSVLGTMVESASLIEASVGGMSTVLARRPLLKGLCAVISAFGYSNIFKNMSNLGNLNRREELSAMRQVGLAAEYMQPFGVNVKFRNALLAKKLLTYAKYLSESKGRCVTVGVVAGRMHEFLPEYMKKGSNFCMKVLNSYPDEVLKALRGEDALSNYYDLIEVVNDSDDLTNSYSLKDSDLKIAPKY